MATNYGQCPNCGSDLKKEVKTETGLTLKAEGEVLTCSGCLMAVLPDEAVKAEDVQAPPPEASPRGEHGDHERYEDEQDALLRDVAGAPSTSPENAPEDSTRDETTVLATDTTPDE